MPARKIQNEQEVLRWFEEGRSYQWMIDEYKRKYNIETVPSLWGNFRRRKGLESRYTRNDELIPWALRDEHRWLFPAMMLRTEARRREGKELREEDATRLSAFVARLKNKKLVVHYDPDTEEGFFYVPAREGIDTDLVRVPERKTKILKRAD
ncbi:hypothetical protein M2302_002217 [Micromonospora sp. A200]|uniref:hypothetical protein n=1 Tax=Micromonospora sp. A200 TaxID=2940568 RepID=UPI0024739363|nr:hypothetical protein [Micromonospora sp. A200]MDH6462042.1 hypothetical protein [Micromonospora sp. A200]